MGISGLQRRCYGTLETLPCDIFNDVEVCIEETSSVTGEYKKDELIHIIEICIIC